MELGSTGIRGCWLVELQPHVDDRGSFTELFRREWIPDAREMVQANLSHSRAGVLRGMHHHRRQADYWIVLEGTAVVGLYDLRSASASSGSSITLRLDASLGLRGLYVPPGVAHGFYAETDLRLNYLVDAPFDASDELGVAWDDPALGIDWPATEPVLSDRDLSNPSLAEALRGLRA